jgi:hypothetical protein
MPPLCLMGTAAKGFSEGKMTSLRARYRLMARHRAWLPFALSGAAVLAAWLLIPSIYDPYVRVPSDRLSFTLGCLPESVQVHVLNSYVVARQAQIAVTAPGAERPAKTVSFQVAKIAAEGGSQQVELTFPQAELKSTLQAAASLGGSANYVYTILFDRTPFIDLRTVHVVSTFPGTSPCAQTDYDGKELLQAIRSPSAKLMRLKLMQEELSDLVLAFNNSAANVCLGFMVVAFLWFAYLLMAGTKRLYFSPDSALLTDFRRFVDQAPSDLKKQGEEALLNVQFQLQNRNFAFAKTMGPAFGFLLTVSSLSAALHPSLQATQDTFRFVSGIQIAVIATFVGLAIRIVAQFGQRVHRDLAERLLLLLRQSTSST